jgi:hypothetical protein
VIPGALVDLPEVAEFGRRIAPVAPALADQPAHHLGAGFPEVELFERVADVKSRRPFLAQGGFEHSLGVGEPAEVADKRLRPRQGSAARDGRTGRHARPGGQRLLVMAGDMLADPEQVGGLGVREAILRQAVQPLLGGREPARRRLTPRPVQLGPKPPGRRQPLAAPRKANCDDGEPDHDQVAMSTQGQISSLRRKAGAATIPRRRPLDRDGGLN